MTGTGWAVAATAVAATLLLMTIHMPGPAQAQAPQPSVETETGAAELREAEALLDLELATEDAGESGDEAGEGQAPAGRGKRLLYELAATGSMVTNAYSPQTDLRFDDTGSYLTGDLLRPMDPLTYPALSLSAYGEWQATGWLLFRGLLNTFELRKGSTLQPPIDGIAMGGQPLRSAVDRGTYIRELSATAAGRGISLEVGRFRTRIADGLVHDDFANGLRGRLDLGQLTSTDLRFELMLGAGGPRLDEVKANTLASLGGEYAFSPFEFVGLFIATSRDRSGEVTNFLRTAMAEGRARDLSADAYRRGRLDPLTAAIVQETLWGALDPCVFVPAPEEGGDGADGTDGAAETETAMDAALSEAQAQAGREAGSRLGCSGDTRGSGQLGYLGLRFQLLPLPGLSMRGALVFAGGDFEIGVVDPLTQQDESLGPDDVEEVDLHVEGWAADLELHYGLGRRWDLAGYAFMLSGDGPLGREADTYRAFIGLAPYWVWTSLFFSGGLNQGLYPNRAAAAGVHGRGATGAGLGLEYAADWGGLEGRAMWLQALAAAPLTPHAGTGLSYGVELDIRGQLVLSDTVSLGSELGMLLPGDFFARRTVAYRAQTMVTVRYGD